MLHNYILSQSSIFSKFSI